MQTNMQFLVLESPASASQAESQFEAYRLQAQAVQQELQYRLQTAQKAINELIRARKKHQKHIIALENECRRLDSENCFLREELHRTRKCVQSSAGPRKREVANAGSQMGSRDTGQREVRQVREELAGLRVECREQGSKVSSCLVALRQTREVQKHVSELISQVQETLITSKRQTSQVETITEPSINQPTPPEDNYSPLLYELQHSTSPQCTEDSLFSGRYYSKDCCLLASPVQDQVQQLETELKSLRCCLKGSNSQLRRLVHHCKSASAQTNRPVANAHKRKGSLALAYQKSLSTQWWLLA